MSRELDWAAVASVFGESSERAILLVDEDFMIRLSNRRMESALGWRRFELVGNSLLEQCIPNEHHDEARRWLLAAFRGAVHVYDTIFVTSGASRLHLQFRLDVVGRAPNHALVLALERTLASSVVGELAVRDMCYEIRLSPTFGKLVSVVTSDGAAHLSRPELPCFAVLHDRGEPCADCPLLSGDERETVVRSRSTGNKRYFEVVSVETRSSDRARLVRRVLDPVLLSSIHEHKLHELTAAAGLTSRETEVLDCLLLGRSIDDIAVMLSISTRTVKYHQTNLLEKLGADSRVDLFRLLL